jgi:ATP-binding cassette subfamily B protein
MTATKRINRFKPAKNPKRTIKDILRFVKPYLWVIILAVVFAVGSCILMLLGPKQLGEIAVELQKSFGSIVNANNEPEITWLGGLNMGRIIQIGKFLIIIYVAMFILDYAQAWVMASVTRKMSIRLRNEIIKKVNRIPLSYYDGEDIGDIMGRVTQDVDAMSNTLNQSIITLISSSVLALGSATAMFLTSWQLAGIAVVLSIIGLFCMAKLLSKSQKYFAQRADIFGELNAIAEENFGNHLAVVTNNAENGFKERFTAELDKHYIANKKGQFLSGVAQPLMAFVGNLSFVAVIVVGAIMATKDPRMIAVIVSFMIYVRYFARPLGDVASAASSFQNALASSERVFEFLHQPEIEDETHIVNRLQPDTVKGNIEFKNVHFGYKEGQTIINNFSVKVGAGNSVAIVGPTGAGKTTIVNLLMKFYKVVSGDIKIDGVSINEITRENVHDLFAMVLQDTWLFNGTLRENLCFNVANATDETVNNAVDAVGLRHFVETLPNGLDALVTENTNISQGQRQLITIARAMIKNAPLLILDEATSSVDTRTEMLVSNAMQKLTEGRTNFVIAHRLSTIRNADLILVMNDGNIVEQGQHDDLLTRNGFYAQLYKSQFSAE